jgi:hypothetical protein
LHSKEIWRISSKEASSGVNVIYFLYIFLIKPYLKHLIQTLIAPQVDPPYRVTFGDESFVDVDYDPMRLATGLPSARENVVGEWFSSEYFLHLCREVNHRAFLKSSI